MLAHYDASDYCVRIGASVRMVIDVSAWDNCVLINAPGQSGIPGDPHYDDLAPLWVAGTMCRWRIAQRQLRRQRAAS